MTRKKVYRLPAPGDAFAVPLADGRYSVCRVLHTDTSKGSRKAPTSPCVLVACSKWIGDEIPNVKDRKLRPILRLTHHSWRGDHEIVWISSSVPKEFIPIGKIPPTEKEAQRKCLTYGGWASMVIQPLMQWRWDNDRTAVLTEDAVKLESIAKVQKSKNLLRNKRLTNVKLTELATHNFFPNWKGVVLAKLADKSRQIMKSAVENLIALGSLPSKKDRLSVLQSCIESFNELNEKQQFIETVERDDICEEFEAIVHACGLGRHKNLADRWRDW